MNNDEFQAADLLCGKIPELGKIPHEDLWKLKTAKYKNCQYGKNCTCDKIANIAKMSQAEKNAEIAKISYEASVKQVVYNKEDLVCSKIASLAKIEHRNSRKPFRAIVFLGFYFFSFAFSKKQSSKSI